MKRIEIDVADAADRLEELIAATHAGTEVVITRDGQPAARLIAIQPTANGGRVPGSAKGLFVVPDDFDTPLPEFDKYTSRIARWTSSIRPTSGRGAASTG